MSISCVFEVALNRNRLLARRRGNAAPCALRVTVACARHASNNPAGRAALLLALLRRAAGFAEDRRHLSAGHHLPGRLPGALALAPPGLGVLLPAGGAPADRLRR